MCGDPHRWREPAFRRVKVHKCARANVTVAHDLPECFTSYELPTRTRLTQLGLLKTQVRAQPRWQSSPSLFHRRRGTQFSLHKARQTHTPSHTHTQIQSSSGHEAEEHESGLDFPSCPKSRLYSDSPLPWTANRTFSAGASCATYESYEKC